MESKRFHHISSTKYIFPFLSKMIALHQNVANCQNTLTVLTQRWRIFPQDIWMGQMCMTDTPVGGLPISQEWLDRMKLVRDRTIPVILPSGKDILVDTMFKIIIWYTNLGTKQIQCRLGRKVCIFIALNASMAGYPTKNNVFLLQNLKRHTFVSPSQSGDVPASYDVMLRDTKVSL